MKWESLEGTIIKIAKAAPIALGAASGLVFGAGSKGPLQSAMDGNGHEALETLTYNYTFYSANNHKFSLDGGLGVKTLGVGLAISKLIGWIAS